MSEVCFKCLGTASGYPVIDRASPSYLLTDGQQSFLLDSGEGVTINMLRFGIDYSKIQAVFISHLHPDHWSGLPVLLQHFHLTQREDDLAVYLPEEGIEPLSTMLEMAYLWNDKLEFAIDLYPIESTGEPFFKANNFIILAQPNSHLEHYKEFIKFHKRAKLESFSFKIDFNDKAIVYSGDIASLEELEPLVKENVDLLVCESMHYDLQKLENLLMRNKIKTTVLTHIPPEREGMPPIAKDVHWAFDGFELEV